MSIFKDLVKRVCTRTQRKVKFSPENTNIYIHKIEDVSLPGKPQTSYFSECKFAKKGNGPSRTSVPLSNQLRYKRKTIS